MLETARPRRVLIATPALDGRVDALYAYSLAETRARAAQHGCDLRVLLITEDSLIQRARNDLLQAAVENDFDDVVFIDADQGWEAEWVFRLLRHDVDCVGGAVVKKTDANESYNVTVEGGLIRGHPANRLLIVDALGTGFLRLSRRAVRALWDGAEEYRDDSGKVNRWVFDVGPRGGRLVGEDVRMCFKLRDAGIQVFLDPTMTCAHIGRKKYVGDFAAWLKRAQAPTAAA